MADTDPPIHVRSEDARGGATPHVTRYVLGVSLFLIILIFAWLLAA